MYIFAYLIAIVAANLSVAHWGVVAEIPTAFVFIAFDLTVRDALHIRWHGNSLAWRMGLLIATGSAISYAINADAARIAIASCVAFGAASAGDALVFHWLRGSWLKRANGSNVVGAAIDSLLFPTIAFGVIMPVIIIGQFAAKVVGGAIWAWGLDRVRKSRGMKGQERGLHVSH
jgi:hypothetical protein